MSKLSDDEEETSPVQKSQLSAKTSSKPSEPVKVGKMTVKGTKSAYVDLEAKEA